MEVCGKESAVVGLILSWCCAFCLSLRGVFFFCWKEIQTIYSRQVLDLRVILKELKRLASFPLLLKKCHSHRLMYISFQCFLPQPARYTIGHLIPPTLSSSLEVHSKFIPFALVVFATAGPISKSQDALEDSSNNSTMGGDTIMTFLSSSELAIPHISSNAFPKQEPLLQNNDISCLVTRKGGVAISLALRPIIRGEKNSSTKAGIAVELCSYFTSKNTT